MKILYLRTLYWFDLKAGGSVGHTAGVINALDKKNNLYVVSNDNLAEVEKEIEILNPIFLPLVLKEISELFYNFKVIKHCKTIESDVIYQRYNGFSFCGAYLAKQKNISFVLEFNSSDVWKIKHWKSNDSKVKTIVKLIYNKLFRLPIVSFIENYNLKNASIIVVVSNVLKQTLVEFGVDKRKIIVNPNGIDVEKYRPDIECQHIKDKYDLNGKIVFGFIGTFGQWHGVENIVLAYAILLKDNPEYKEKTKLLMIGDGIKMSEVKKYINEFNISDNVVLTGLISQKDGPAYLNTCDILVNATIPNPDGTEFFGSPTKLFEYMAIGKAIISSDIGQMSDVLEHGNTAFMVKPGDVLELKDAIITLINDEKLRIKLGKNARKEVIKNFTWDKHVGKILEKLNE